MEVVTEKPNQKVIPKGYKRTEVGVIPEDWEISFLEELTTITRLAGAEYSSYWEEDETGKIIALRGFNIGQNKIIEKDFARISDELSKKLRRSRLQKRDIVYPCVGTIGNAVVIEEDDKYHIQQNIARIIPKSDIAAHFIAYYLMSPLGLNEVTRFNATSSQPNVLVGSLRKYRVPLPPTLEEQQAIADSLSDVDALIAELDALIEKKQQVKKGAMQQLLTDKKRLPGFDGECEWEEYQLGALGDFKTSSVNKKTKESEKNVRLLNYMDVYRNNIISNNFDFSTTTASTHDRNSSNLLEGDIVFTPSSETPDDIGHSAVITEDLNNTVYSYHLMRFRPFDNNIISKKFSGYVFNAPSVLEQFASRATGSTRYTISKKDFKEVKVRFPKSLEEQNKIAEILFDMDAEIQGLQSKRAKYKQVKLGMMQELLTGKTRLV